MPALNRDGFQSRILPGFMWAFLMIFVHSQGNVSRAGLLLFLLTIFIFQSSLRASETRGQKLAQRYCTPCHTVPLPEHLPRSRWDFVLDWMGNFLGFENREGRLSYLVNADQIPSPPVMKPEELHEIREYYRENAPHQVPQPEKPRSQSLSSMFRAETWRPDSVEPFVPMVRIDTRQQRLFVGDAPGKRLRVYSKEGDLREVHRVTSEPIHIEFEGDDFYLTLIGDLDRDRRKGEILHYRSVPEGYALRRVLGGYFRIAHSLRSDLNDDGIPDFLISAFGDYDRGRVAWLETSKDRYRERILIDRSGAVKGAVCDLNGDGKKEILVLMAQGRNQLLVFRREEDGSFTEQVLIEKFPGFGYNDLLMGDLNGDQLPDLVTINGNNMEMPEPPLRGYHGVRVYLNRGDLRFEEVFFYPMYGATRGVLTDFDRDGYPDIAITAYYPDWKAQRPETFVLLRNQGGQEFEPFSIPETENGRWLSIDAGDLDRDGDDDLVLGNGMAVTGISPADEKRLMSDYGDTAPLLILWNDRNEPGTDNK